MLTWRRRIRGSTEVAGPFAIRGDRIVGLYIMWGQRSVLLAQFTSRNRAKKAASLIIAQTLEDQADRAPA